MRNFPFAIKIPTAFLLLTLLPLLSIAQKKPNILWITYEDTSPNFIGCYGNKDARTPVIDHLAEIGVRFTNAFSTGTVCSPSRTTLITGIKTYVAGTGNHRSNYNIPSFVHGFPLYMQKAGYYTSNNVKTDYNVKNEEQFVKETWDESSTKAGWWNRKPGQPFFSVFNFIDSHQSRTMTTPYQTYVKQVLNELTPNEIIGDNAFQLPPFFHDTPEIRKEFARVYNSIKLTDKKIGELINKLQQDHLMDSTIIFCYADHGEGIPRAKTNGINLGYRVPFIAWFPPMYKDLSPWKKSGLVTDELISFEDMAPTMLSLAGAAIPSYMKGRVLAGNNTSEHTDHLILSSDRSDNGIDAVRSVTNGRYVYSRNFMPFMPEARYIRYMEISAIKQQMRKDLAARSLNALQKKIFDPRPAEYLFDIEHDPWEMHNLTDDPKYQGTLVKMRQQLADEVLSSKDIMLLPEYELESISEKGNAFEYRLDVKRFPVKEIYAAAKLSGIRNEKTALQQVKLLSNENKIVRYWAIVGLRSQNAEILQRFKPEILKAMKDVYPPVAITASAIGYQFFNDPNAQNYLIVFCKNENDMLSLMTINYLLYMPNNKAFTITIQELYKNPALTYNVKAACLDFLGSLGLVPNNFAYEK
jgi:arylsulfatase A-like enzyme